MPITFTDEELRTLLQAVYMAACVSDFHREADDRDERAARRLDDLEQKLLSLAGEFGAEDMAALDVPSGSYQPSRELEENSFASRCLQAQEDHIYWDRLVADLADRDLHETGRFSSWEEMSLDERDALLREAEEKYWDSFERDGIRHLRLATQQTGGGNN